MAIEVATELLAPVEKRGFSKKPFPAMSPSKHLSEGEVTEREGQLPQPFSRTPFCVPAPSPLWRPGRPLHLGEGRALSGQPALLLELKSSSQHSKEHQKKGPSVGGRGCFAACSGDSRVYSIHKGHRYSSRMATQPLKGTDRRCTQDIEDPRGWARLQCASNYRGSARGLKGLNPPTPNRKSDICPPASSGFLHPSKQYNLGKEQRIQ